MFTGKLTVERLTQSQITDQVAEDLNALLRKQRTDARLVTPESLSESIKKMWVVIVRDDTRHIVGLGVLTLSGGLNFECAEMRHLIIADHLDLISTGMRILEALKEIYVHNVDYIDAGSWVQNARMNDLFIALGFKEKPNGRFRLRIKPK